MPAKIRELRLVLTTDRFEEALAFYKDALGLEEEPSVQPPNGRVAILAAGRATLELAEPSTAAFIDEVEVGRPISGPVRIAFEVTDAAASTRDLRDAGAEVIAEPKETPFGSLNARIAGPGGLQVTLFQRK